MVMHLRLPDSVDQTLEALKRLVTDADMALSSWPAFLNADSLEQAKDTYLRWVETASLMIGNYLLDDDLLGGLRAHSYWRIFDLTPDAPRPYPLVEHEIRLQQRRLNRVID